MALQPIPADKFSKFSLGCSRPGRPTLSPGESVANLRATDDGFDPEKAGERDYGFVQLHQLAVEHLTE